MARITNKMLQRPHGVEVGMGLENGRLALRKMRHTCMTAPDREYTVRYKGSVTVQAHSEEDAVEKASALVTEQGIMDDDLDIEEGDCVMCNGTKKVPIGHEDEGPCLCTKEE